MKLILSNGKYTFLKWFAIIFLPAIAFFYPELANIWGLDYGVEVAKTCNAVGVFIAALIGISHINYTNELEKNK